MNLFGGVMMRRHGVMISGVILLACGSLLADNCVQMFVQRNGWTEGGVDQQSYQLEFNVLVSAQTVEVKFPGTSSYIAMEYEEDDQDFDLDSINTEFPTLSQLFSGLGIANGNCYIRIDKDLSTESVYRFSVNTAAIIADNFPGFATDVYPGEGQTVGSTVTFTWSNPDGYEGFVGPWMGVEQGYYYYDGGMKPAGTTEWTCQPLEDGPATFEIGYASLMDGIAGVMTYVSGKTIVWGLSDYSPAGWAPGKPLTGLVSDLDVHFQVLSLPKAAVSFGYFQTRAAESSESDTYNAVVRVMIPDAWAVFLKRPSSPEVLEELEWILPNTYRIRFLYSSFAEMMAGVSSGTYTVHVFDLTYTESVYSFQIDAAPVHLEDFPEYVGGVQPPRDSLIEIPTTFSWALPDGYTAGVGVVVLKNSGFIFQMRPPQTTSIILDTFDPAWNQVILMTMGTVNGVAGPMTYQNGFEIDWDQMGSAPKGWPKDVPYTYLGSEWMGDYYAIEPGQCVFHLPGDLNGDCRVSLEDIATLAEFWLMDCRGTQVGTDCWAFL
jgi:hypothetical protein